MVNSEREIESIPSILWKFVEDDKLVMFFFFLFCKSRNSYSIFFQKEESDSSRYDNLFSMDGGSTGYVIAQNRIEDTFTKYLTKALMLR